MAASSADGAGARAAASGLEATGRGSREAHGHRAPLRLADDRRLPAIPGRRIQRSLGYFTEDAHIAAMSHLAYRVHPGCIPTALEPPARRRTGERDRIACQDASGRSQPMTIRTVRIDPLVHRQVPRSSRCLELSTGCPFAPWLRGPPAIRRRAWHACRDARPPAGIAASRCGELPSWIDGVGLRKADSLRACGEACRATFSARPCCSRSSCRTKKRCHDASVSLLP
jgi:hypothetical protein